eukprot:TRINITY_DN7152_c0_g1_i1.p2 TRINITY_DN7152_c0_g1~~TRINITY_DN7152_c0_g1_i1.p2  ORF type:complete len:105 (+),score=42.33 TRINITY_DN7152_c0_g1_i1:209-523(+)
MVLNQNKGSAKLIAKSLFLTATSSQAIRIKPAPGAKVVDLNGKPSDAVDQLSLAESEFGVLKVSFQIEGQATAEQALASCQYVELPIKVEGFGVIKLKVNFSKR